MFSFFEGLGFRVRHAAKKASLLVQKLAVA